MLRPPTAFNTTNVVPSEVLERAAPAENDSSVLYPLIGLSRKDIPIGAPIPVRATMVARGIEWMRVERGVSSPPRMSQSEIMRDTLRILTTFEHYQKKTDVADR